VTIILAGNVFTAGVPPIFLCLLHGSAVLVKASSDEDLFARLLLDTLRSTEPRLAEIFEVVSVAGTDDRLDEALRSSDRVIAYGSDVTISALRSRVPLHSELIGHGHGIGLGYVARTELTDRARAQGAARQLALDVGAYDQRGCLSPQTVFVESGGTVDPRAFTGLLHRALGQFERRMPRGGLPEAAAAFQMQWRGVAAATSELHDGGRFSTVFRSDGSSLGSCGWRNIEVVECEGAESFLERVTPFGIHLKAIGVGGDAVRKSLVGQLPPPLCPRVTRLGRMQQPDPLGLADGVPSDSGILRWVDSR
jgi:hypothetical protein